jgi:hypothetical protein
MDTNKGDSVSIPFAPPGIANSPFHLISIVVCCCSLKMNKYTYTLAWFDFMQTDEEIDDIGQAL